MLKHSAVFFVLTLLLAFSTTAQQSQPTPKAAPPESSTIPAEAAQLVNPIKPTPESIAQGKKYYGYDCAMCHGENGDGKGSVAVDEKLELKDFRDPATLRNRTDGELFYILKTGKGHMPPEPIRFTQNELWNIINYVRSLSHKAGQ